MEIKSVSETTITDKMTTQTYWSFDLYEEKRDAACKTNNNNYLNLNKILNIFSKGSKQPIFFPKFSLYIVKFKILPHVTSKVWCNIMCSENLTSFIHLTATIGSLTDSLNNWGCNVTHRYALFSAMNDPTNTCYENNSQRNNKASNTVVK